MKESDLLYVDHEVRIRIQESTSLEIKNLLRWILGVAISAVIIPILMKKFGLD